MRVVHLASHRVWLKLATLSFSLQSLLTLTFPQNRHHHQNHNHRHPHQHCHHKNLHRDFPLSHDLLLKPQMAIIANYAIMKKKLEDSTESRRRVSANAIYILSID